MFTSCAAPRVRSARRATRHPAGHRAAFGPTPPPAACKTHTCEDVPAACPAHALLPAARVRRLEQAQHFSVIGGGSAVPGSSEGDGEVHPRVVVLSCSGDGTGGRTRVTSSHGLVAWKCVRTDLSHLSLSHRIDVMAARA